MYDVVIIGGGPAGMTAAIYASRRGMKTLILSSDIGGQITKTDAIENYPGLDLISGVDMAKKFFAQAKKFGATFTFEEVKEIKKLKEKFTIKTAGNKYDAKTVILAFGKKPRELGVPGEEEFKGRGVSYCATCDAPFFKNKHVAIVGGGNSALSAAVVCSSYAEKTYLIYRGADLRGEEVLLDKVKSLKNVEILLNTEIKKINGDKKVTSVELNNGKNMLTDGVIVEIGFVIDRSILDDLVKLDKANQVIIDSKQLTSTPGIFAAGDLTDTPFKQIVIAAAEGAKAALSAFDYLQKLEGKKGITADWH
jgi:thioredoxin reductase (NADPH)